MLPSRGRTLLQDVLVQATQHSLPDALFSGASLSIWNSHGTCQCQHRIRHYAAASEAGPPTAADTTAPASPADSPSTPTDPLKPRMTPLLQTNQYTKPARYIPWVFSRHLSPLKHVANRMQFLLQSLEQEQVQAAHASKQHLDPFESGDILEVRMRVPEAQGAEYVFRGVCIARYDKGIRTAFKLLNVYPESGPVVQHLPLYMPDLLSVKVVGRVPKAKRGRPLYYLVEEKAATGTYQTAPQLLAADGSAAPRSKAGSKSGGGKGKAGAQKAKK